jgi:WD40 repeat protein
MTGHRGFVRAVAAAELPDGRLVAVTSGDDTTVRVWELTTGTALGEPIAEHRYDVWAVAVINTPVVPDEVDVFAGSGLFWPGIGVGGAIVTIDVCGRSIGSW